MESQNKYFASDQWQVAIKKYLKKIRDSHEGTDFEIKRNLYIDLILSSILKEADLWDINCSFNIAWIGDNFINRLSTDTDITAKEKTDDIFAFCFRFLFELYLSIKADLGIEFEKMRQFTWDNLDNFESGAKSQILFAIRDMPIAILKSLINHENIESIKEFNKTTEKAEAMRSEWNRELDERTSKVTALKENLDQYKAAFNFVGLFQGFDEMASDKVKEKDNILFYLKLFGFLTILPIIAEVLYIYISGKTLSELKDTMLIALFPTISLVAILIYFFRILLFNFRAAKSQILQLELRKALCRFIQNYVEYSMVIKQKDKDSLTKFENIVFSGIVSDGEKLPSTFDGIEQLQILIKSIKS